MVQTANGPRLLVMLCDRLAMFVKSCREFRQRVFRQLAIGSRHADELVGRLEIVQRELAGFAVAGLNHHAFQSDAHRLEGLRKHR